MDMKCCKYFQVQSYPYILIRDTKVKSWISQVFIKATRLQILTTAKIYQLNTYNKVKLFNRRVTVITTIYASITTFSHPVRGIYFFILPFEKLLQFDWPRVVVFQLNLKYLHVKITNLLRVVV